MNNFPQKSERISFLVPILDRTALLSMGTMSLLYLTYGPHFAKVHIQPSFSKVPVFVGEIFLAACLVLLMIKFALTLSVGKKIRFGRGHVLLALYIAFIFLKTWQGNAKWGPLALRHAALFYYPLFAVIAYHFYDRRFFDQKTALAACLLIPVAVLHCVYDYAFFPLIVSALIFMSSVTSPSVKTAFAAWLFLVLPYQDFFGSRRTLIVGNAMGFIVLFGLFLKNFPIRFKHKIFFLIIFIAGLSLLISKVADPNAVKSMTSFKKLITRWHQQEEKIQKRGPVKVVRKEGVRLFQEGKETRPQSGVLVSATPYIVPPDKPPQEEKTSYRSLKTAENNIFFRIFIWRDMLRDLKQNRPIWGMDFGYPFYSPSLISLNWGKEAWARDGWIAAHNSYLEMIYRGGIIGVLLIGFLFSRVFGLARQVFKTRKGNGKFFLSIMIYWLTVASIGVFFELPYNAIPFWIFFGIMTAHFQPAKE